MDDDGAAEDGEGAAELNLGRRVLAIKVDKYKKNHTKTIIMIS